MIESALVLTAGYGTRLRPLTLVRAKPALPVAGVPLIHHILQWLAASAVTDIVLNLHYLPETLTGVVGDGSDLGVRVRYSWEQPEILGSAGGPRQALDIVGADPLLIVNGDTLTDLDLNTLVEAHFASGAMVTLALVPNLDPLQYGGVRLDSRSRVIGFARRGPAAGESFHFIGVQVVAAEVLRALPAGVAASTIGGVYDQVIADRPGAISGFVSGASFWDIGTPLEYWRTARRFIESIPDGDARHGRQVRIGAGSVVNRSLLWDDVEIGSDCRLEDCIVTDGVQIPDGSSHRRVMFVRTPDGQIAPPVPF